MQRVLYLKAALWIITAETTGLCPKVENRAQILVTFHVLGQEGMISDIGLIPSKEIGMPQTPTQAEDDPPATRQRRNLLNASIKDNYKHLCASALAVILNRHRGMKEQQLIDLAEEVVHEAISRALTKAAEFDPSRRPVPWLMRFILNVLMESGRRAKRHPRQSDFGDITWNQLLASLCCDASSVALTAYLPRLDQALGRIANEQREILLYRFKKGLDGEELAQAVGAPSSGAARVRLHRALVALRQEFLTSANQEELNP
jgi:RNA polymerase sigma factor (sigma-70 family)